MSNVTGSRAHEIQNDDVEVPGNIGTPEARLKLRYRLGEQTFILIPGGQELYVGTPHTHDSLYSEIMQNPDAKCLIFRMFESEKRFETIIECFVDFKPVYIFSGIGRNSKLLTAGKDFQVHKSGIGFKITFDESHPLIDVYSEALWPERFTAKEMQKRRRKCRTLNEWDSQYQLHAKPVGDIRLNPERLVPYDVEPILKRANGEYYMTLGERLIVGMTVRWDPSSGKLKSDTSAVELVLHDDIGNKYWHRSLELTGEVVQHDGQGNIIGGQVWQLCDLVAEFKVPRITIETNGIGGFAPSALKGALKKRKIRCGVTEHHSSQNKNKRILEALEGPLISGMLWVHVSVVDTPDGENTSKQYRQMQRFNPALTEQEDDHLDSLGGAVTDAPERVGKIHSNIEANESPNWRPDSGVHEATLDFEN